MTTEAEHQPASGPVDLDTWWAALRASALVGTSRREPPWPLALGHAARPGASRDQTLLDAAALGDALRRAGRRPAREPVDVPVHDPPAPSRELVTPPAAVDLLELLLHQRPLGETGQALLLRHWVASAVARGQVLPHRVLPGVLELATRRTDLRDPLGRVLGERGRWLATHNPIWAWAAGSAPDGPESLGALRARDPAAAYARIAATWVTDPVRSRTAALRVLAVGLTAADEPLLETALDDRSAEVRGLALDLLDRLPTSARADRMADRLRVLVHRAGDPEVALPDPPDAEGVRDGLTAPERGRSARAWWLHRIVVGAPLAVWTELLGTDPDGVAGRTVGHDVVRPALVEAAARRRDAVWCRALLGPGWAPQLAAALPPEEHQALLAHRLRSSPLAEATQPLSQLDPPWGAPLSTAVVEAARRDTTGPHAIRLLRDQLGLALHPTALPTLQRLADDAADRPTLLRDLRVVLRDATQFRTLHDSISEAFP